MDYEKRTADRYHEHYIDFYPTAYAEAAVGGTTRYAAEQEAEARAHYSTMRLMCQTDLYFLATEIYGMREAKVHGRRIWFPPIHGQLCDELGAQHDSLIELSRNMLKTTVAKIWVVQQILVDPVNVAIGMWSRSSARVRSELKSIGAMLVNPKLLELFPDRLIGDTKKWEKKNYGQQPAITVTRKVPDDEGVVREVPMDEGQIEVWGLDSVVTGRHYTHHYYDDIIDRDNTQTANMIEKTQEQWRSIQAMRSPSTIEKMIGTPWHQLDLYATAEEEGFFDRKLVIPGVGADGKIYYPYFTREFLDAQKRKLGPYLYSCQYELDTRPKAHRMFLLPVPQWSKESFPANPKYFVAMDPSTGRSEKHDKTGIAVAAVDREAPTAVFFVEAYSEQLKPEELADRAVALIEKYSPDAFGIEYGLQLALKSLIQLKISERKKTAGYFRTPQFVDIKTGGGAGSLNKADKIDRTLGAMVRDRRAYFMPEMKTLFAQMAMFNPNVQKNDDDILDACSMLIQTVPSFHQSHWYGVEVNTPVGGFTLEFFKGKAGGRKRDRIFAA